MDSAVRTGTVDFSTTILSEVATSAILRAQSSQFLMLAARPAPIPVTLVGVLTETKMISASRMVASMSVEKKRFLQNENKGWISKGAEIEMRIRRLTFHGQK